MFAINLTQNPDSAPVTLFYSTVSGGIGRLYYCSWDWRYVVGESLNILCFGVSINLFVDMCELQLELL